MTSWRKWWARKSVRKCRKSKRDGGSLTERFFSLSTVQREETTRTGETVAKGAGYEKKWRCHYRPKWLWSWTAVSSTGLKLYYVIEGISATFLIDGVLYHTFLPYIFLYRGTNKRILFAKFYTHFSENFRTHESNRIKVVLPLLNYLSWVLVVKFEVRHSRGVWKQVPLYIPNTHEQGTLVDKRDGGGLQEDD